MFEFFFRNDWIVRLYPMNINRYMQKIMNIFQNILLTNGIFQEKLHKAYAVISPAAMRPPARAKPKA